MRLNNYLKNKKDIALSVLKKKGLYNLIKASLICTSLFLFPHCASVPVKPAASPFNWEDVPSLISALKKQESKVHSFFSTGKGFLKKNGSESGVNILIAGVREPFKIKIEATHRWGRPLLYLLIRGTELRVISFHDKSYYIGHIGRPGLMNFFPETLGPKQLWSFIRGFPVIENHYRAELSTGKRLTLLDKKSRQVQVVDFLSENNFPEQISYPDRNLLIMFSDFKNNDGIFNARNRKLCDEKNNTVLTLELKKTVFNQSITEAVFQMEIPPGFIEFFPPGNQGLGTQ